MWKVRRRAPPWMEWIRKPRLVLSWISFPQRSVWARKSCAVSKAANKNPQTRTGEAANKNVVSFVVHSAAPIPQRGLIDTGSFVSILTVPNFNRGAFQTGALLRPYQNDLCAAFGTTIKTFGMAERLSFRFGGYELETKFVVVAEIMG